MSKKIASPPWKVKMLQRPWLLARLTWAMLLAPLALTQECFPRSESLLPKVMNYASSVSEYDEEYYAVTGNDDFTLYGGMTNQKLLSTLNEADSPIPIVVRMDLDKNTRRWAKTINADNGKAEKVVGIALNPSGTKFAVYMSREAGNNEENFLMILNSSDGSPAVTFPDIDKGP